MAREEALDTCEILLSFFRGNIRDSLSTDGTSSRRHPMANFSMDFEVKGTVPFVRQKGLTCWAASTAMMHGWRTGTYCSMTEALAKAGNRLTDSPWKSWQSLADAGKLIPMDELPQLAYAMGMKNAPMRSFSDVEIYNLMFTRNTPLMVVGREESWGNVCHFYVVKGIYNDETGITSVTLNDPMDEEPGSTMDFLVLYGQMESLAKYNDALMQVLYY
jgi:hypothetical protein